MWNIAYPICGENDNDSDVSPYMTIMIKISHKKMTRMAMYHHV